MVPWMEPLPPIWARAVAGSTTRASANDEIPNRRIMDVLLPPCARPAAARKPELRGGPERAAAAMSCLSGRSLA